MALAAQGLAFWSVLVVLGPGVVGSKTWLALQGLLAFVLVVLQTAPNATADWNLRVWLAAALYALYFAAFFAGANFALDALHGAQRPRAEVAAHLGGLELWQFFCPGVFSLAVGALAGGLAREAPWAQLAPHMNR